MGLPELPRLTHLAVESGAGGTTLSLQYGRQVLLAGGRVIWLCSVSPHSTRFAQLFGELSPSLLAKFHLVEFGAENINAINDVITLLASLNPNLVVIDDWTPRTGQVSTITLDAIRRLDAATKRSSCSLLLVSSLYSDAGGEVEWRIRGEASIKELEPTTWRLTKKESGGYRVLKTGECEVNLRMSASGLT